MLRCLPAATVLIAALIAVLPFGADEIPRYMLSFLPLAVIHYWSARRPTLVPVPLIFAVGLVVDILTNGPVGYWALLALLTAGLAPGDTWLLGRSSVASRALDYALAMLVVAGVAWAVATLYSGANIPARPFLAAAFACITIYPLMALGLLAIDRIWETPRPHLFVRGG